MAGCHQSGCHAATVSPRPRPVVLKGLSSRWQGPAWARHTRRQFLAMLQETSACHAVCHSVRHACSPGQACRRNAQNAISQYDLYSMGQFVESTTRRQLSAPTITSEPPTPAHRRGFLSRWHSFRTTSWPAQFQPGGTEVEAAALPHFLPRGGSHSSQELNQWHVSVLRISYA